MTKRFVCLGSLNIDLTFQVPRLPEEHEKLRCSDAHLACGGSAANTAYWLSRLGAEVAMLGCVGVDHLGEWCVTELAKAGVDVRGVQRSAEATTGIAAVFVNPTSKRMVSAGGANAHFDPARLSGTLFDPNTHLHVATPLPQISLPVLSAAKAAGATTSCDLDEPPDPYLTPLVDLCFVTHSGLVRRFGDVSLRSARESIALDAPLNLVVTLGARGAIVVTAEDEYFVPVQPVAVVDRTGGGDAFDAGFLWAWGQGCAWPDALRSALRLAVEVITRPGARPGDVDVSALREPLTGSGHGRL